MKKIPWLLLLVWMLSACGSPATLPKAGAAKKTADAQALPLPASELTRMATIAGNLPAPTRTRKPAKAKKTPIPRTPTPEVQLPPPTVPAAVLQPAPTVVVILPLILDNPAVIATLPPVAQVLPTATVKTDIIQPQATRAGTTRLPFLFLSGVACLAGIAILVVGITMASSLKPKVQQTISLLNIADLQPRLGWVELKGKIAKVPRPLDKNEKNALAVLRLVIEENDIKEGWKVVLDKVKAVEFSLEDNTGEVWVSPDQIDLSFMGEGAFASINQAEEALKILGLQPNSAWGRGLRYRIWELRSGQSLVAMGNVQQRFILTADADQSLTLSPEDAVAKPAAEAAKPGFSMNTTTLLVFAVAAAAILVGISALIWYLLH